MDEAFDLKSLTLRQPCNVTGRVCFFLSSKMESLIKHPNSHLKTKGKWSPRAF